MYDRSRQPDSPLYCFGLTGQILEILAQLGDVSQPEAYREYLKKYGDLSFLSALANIGTSKILAILDADPCYRQPEAKPSHPVVRFPGKVKEAVRDSTGMVFPDYLNAEDVKILKENGRIKTRCGITWIAFFNPQLGGTYSIWVASRGPDGNWNEPLFSGITGYHLDLKKSFTETDEQLVEIPQAMKAYRENALREAERVNGGSGNFRLELSDAGLEFLGTFHLQYEGSSYTEYFDWNNPPSQTLAFRFNKVLKDPLVSWADLTRDQDDDGLTDLAEARLGTDPLKPDTDNDGISDRFDPDPFVPWTESRGDVDQLLNLSLNVFANNEFRPLGWGLEAGPPHLTSVYYSCPNNRKITFADQGGYLINNNTIHGITMDDDERPCKEYHLDCAILDDHQMTAEVECSETSTLLRFRKINNRWYMVDCELVALDVEGE